MGRSMRDMGCAGRVSFSPTNCAALKVSERKGKTAVCWYKNREQNFQDELQ